MTADPRRAAIVLAGGRATRLGGADKAEIEVDGRMLIDGVLQAVAACEPIVVVGPDHLTRPGVRVVRERPAFGGPVAALEAALQALSDAVAETWVLACDLPRAGGIVDVLSEHLMTDDVDALMLRDSGGRVQPLAGRYRVAPLRAAIGALPTAEGAAMRRITEALRVQEIDDERGASMDLDTWEDVSAYRAEQSEGRRDRRVRRRETA